MREMISVEEWNVKIMWKEQVNIIFCEVMEVSPKHKNYGWWF